jgi:hypothetical protein
MVQDPPLIKCLGQAKGNRDLLQGTLLEGWKYLKADWGDG